MKTKTRHLWIFAAILLSTAIVHADKPAKTLTFLSPNSVDFVSLLPDPPAKDSLEQKEEIALILKLQDARTPEQMERIKLEDKFNVFVFSDVLGDWFSPEKMPETKAFFEQVVADSKVLSSAAKDHWDRPRPPFAHPKVKSALEAEKEGSYPSGHASRSILCALILSEIDPADRAKLIERGQLVGWDRVIAGVHYPSDIGAGRTLGQAEFRAMMTTPKFQTELEQVRAEFVQARKNAAAPAHQN